MPLLLGALPLLRRFAQSDSSLQRPDMEANPHEDINKKKKIDSENSK